MWTGELPAYFWGPDRGRYLETQCGDDVGGRRGEVFPLFASATVVRQARKSMASADPITVAMNDAIITGSGGLRSSTLVPEMRN